MKKPGYARIADVVETRIRDGAIPAGAILLEGPLADLFRSSRSPVKQALRKLQDDGLVRRFEGRGLAVVGAPPVRFQVSAEILGFAPATLAERPDPLQSIYYSVEREIILQSLRGPLRVNELALARHHGIGRAAARDILLRARQAGLLVKGENAHWRIVALDATRCANLYDLRLLLEPTALALALPRLPPAEIDEMRGRLRSALARFPQIGVSELDLLETDLHVTVISQAPNTEIAEALSRAHPTHIAGKHLQIALAREPMVDPFMGEHLEVFDALARGDAPGAAGALHEHLRRSKEKVIERLSAYLALSPPEPADYIMAS